MELVSGVLAISLIHLYHKEITIQAKKKKEVVLAVNLSFKFTLLPLSYAAGCLWLGQTVQ
jgi:hypothetical protein